MQELNLDEIDQVSGARRGAGSAVAATLGLMAFAAASPVVIGVGCAAIVGHFVLEYLNQ
ncbi:hypothetical protein [Massilia sp. CF038]|uniref:hypothetical protein n=1 Tax=Massilia sp. CF038 TaxID=1881045 RepID=UPI0009233B2E|nr:hypothetical protein [Massilia sp. CF038]SHH02876.1 hypothetical protein SAMN05428948_2404 [Massilia sp. CF038]